MSRLIDRRQVQFAIFVLAVLVLSSIFAPFLATQNPFEPDMAVRLQGPSLQHFFGTDALGRDLYSRILFGGRASMLLSLVAAFFSLGFGTLVGILGGYYGGKVDHILTMVTNIFQGIPGTCFMVAIAGILGSSMESLVLALVITSWAGFARIVRSEVLSVMEESYIEVLRALGCTTMGFIRRHLFPHVLNRLLILFMMRLGRGILSIAGLSFLGLGVQPPTPDWSVMVNEAILFYHSAPHLIIIPGLFIFALIYSLNTLGDGLRDYFDVREAGVRNE